MLIAVGGLPGTGKSTVIHAVSTSLAVPVLAKDQVEAALWRSGITASQGSGYAAYAVLTALAREELRDGRSVVLDSVMTSQTIRTEWRAVAAECGASFRPVECICSDDVVHRARIDGRARGIEGWPELTWQDVEDVRMRYEPWTTPRLILDAMQPLAENASRLREYLVHEAA